MSIYDYIREHTVRGECKCGTCIDTGNAQDPSGHTIDLIFFKVAKAGDPDKDTFIRLTKEHRGEYGDCDPLDGKDHGYMELGGWIGDQGAALLYMALGSLLGVFTLITPRAMLGESPEMQSLVMQMAQQGLLTVTTCKVPSGIVAPA